LVKQSLDVDVVPGCSVMPEYSWNAQIFMKGPDVHVVPGC
jgi:hypothetical protein